MDMGTPGGDCADRPPGVDECDGMRYGLWVRWVATVRTDHQVHGYV